MVPTFRRSTDGSRSFNFSAPPIWNALPEDVVSTPSLSTFRRRVKAFLLRDKCGAHYTGGLGAEPPAGSRGSNMISVKSTLQTIHSQMFRRAKLFILSCVMEECSANLILFICLQFRSVHAV